MNGTQDLKELFIGEAFRDEEVIFLQDNQLTAHVVNVFLVIFAHTQIRHEGWNVMNLNLTLEAFFIRGFFHSAVVQSFIIVFDCLNKDLINFH